MGNLTFSSLLVNSMARWLNTIILEQNFDEGVVRLDVLSGWGSQRVFPKTEDWPNFGFLLRLKI